MPEEEWAVVLEMAELQVADLEAASVAAVSTEEQTAAEAALSQAQEELAHAHEVFYGSRGRYGTISDGLMLGTTSAQRDGGPLHGGLGEWTAQFFGNDAADADKPTGVAGGFTFVHPRLPYGGCRRLRRGQAALEGWLDRLGTRTSGDP